MLNKNQHEWKEEYIVVSNLYKSIESYLYVLTFL